MTDKSLENKENMAGSGPRANGVSKPAPATVPTQAPGEVGGPKGLEPTRYGDWERKGIASDF